MNNNMLESAEFYNRRYHNFSSRIILPTLALFLFAVAFLSFAKKEIAIVSTAIIEPSKVLSNIQSTSNNVILRNNLQENKFIKTGDLLIQYDSENEELQQETSQFQLNNLRAQREQLELLKLSIESGTSQFLIEDNYGYYQTFVDYLNQVNNLTASISHQNETTSLPNSTEYLDSQIASLKAQNITKVSQELTNLSNQITELEGTNRLQENAASKNSIIASENGILHLNQEVVGANIVPEGTMLAQVYPEMKSNTVVKITSYIPSAEISSIAIGDTVRFSTKDDSGENFDLTAKLSSIDSSATRTKNGNFFKVESEVQVNQKEVNLLKYGLEGRFILITGEKSFLNYYIDRFIGEK